MSSSSSASAVEVSLRSPASPSFVRILFRSAATPSPSPRTATNTSVSPRSTPARPSTAVLRAELHRSLWSDSPATAPVPSVAPPLPSSHAARRVGSGGVQRRLLFDSASDFTKALPTPTPFHLLPANVKLTLPPLSAAIPPLSHITTPTSLLPDGIADGLFLHPSSIQCASPHLPPPRPPRRPPLPSSTRCLCRAVSTAVCLLLRPCCPYPISACTTSINGAVQCGHSEYENDQNARRRQRESTSGRRTESNTAISQSHSSNSRRGLADRRGRRRTT